MKYRPKHTLIVAGGGTGGHVLAGIAVADQWRARYGFEARVVFVGAKGGIEEKLVPRAGYPLKLLKLGSLNRVSLWRKIRTAFQLPVSFVKSVLFIMSLRPKAILGVGGYASGPVVLMGRVLSGLHLIRAKTAILEQNSVAGLTNRILGRFVNVVCSAFPGLETQFDLEKLVVTGNPVRAIMKPLPAAPREPFTIFIFGGSQGAIGMNTLVLAALPELKDLFPRIRFVHQTGEKDYQRVLAAHQKAGSPARVEKFIYEMDQTYAVASLVICRAGSSTLSELAAVGRAAVLVPLPTAADNHQEENAKLFFNAGASFVLHQQGSKGSDLAKLIRELIRNPAQIDQMESAVRRFYAPTAADAIVLALSDRRASARS